HCITCLGRLRYVCWFFYHCDRDHRSLHSFPTRRSSDLNGAAASLLLRSGLQGGMQSRAARGGAKIAGGSGDRRKSVRRDATLFRDRKSTRLNSSHGSISYAVFCLKKKKKTTKQLK